MPYKGMGIDRTRSTPSKLRGPAFRVATDPKPAADGLCVVAGCERRRPRIAVAHEDPFCSTVCCKRWYEVVV